MEQSAVALLFMLGSYTPALFSICMKTLGKAMNVGDTGASRE